MPRAELTSVSDYIVHEAARQRRQRTWITLALTGIVLVTAMLVLIYQAVNPESEISKFAASNAATLASIVGTIVGFYFGRATEKPPAAGTHQADISDSLHIYEELVRANERSLEQQKRILELEAALARERENSPTAA